MVYSFDENQLRRLWSVICCLEAMREIQDPTFQSEMITKAQTFLTAFVLDLAPSSGDQARPGIDQITGFDA